MGTFTRTRNHANDRKLGRLGLSVRPTARAGVGRRVSVASPVCHDHAVDICAVCLGHRAFSNHPPQQTEEHA